MLEPDAVGALLEFLGGLAFNGLAHAEGRGALAGRLGTRVAAPAINLPATRRAPRGTLPRAFDLEGVPKAPLPLIQDGVAHGGRPRPPLGRAGRRRRALDRPRARPGGSPYGPGARRTSCSPAATRPTRPSSPRRSSAAST